MFRIEKKGQGAIEYIILLAIIVVLGLVAVSIISSFPDSAMTITKAQSEAYWLIQGIALKGVAVDSNGDGILKFENKTDTRITLTSLVINGNAIDITDKVLYPSEEANINLSNLVPCTGTSEEYRITINYIDAYELVHSFMGITPVYVGCATDVTGTTDQAPFAYYGDKDGDTYGEDSNSITSTSATPPAGYVTNSTDCNDSSASIHPDAAENTWVLCSDDIDNDCDDGVDCDDSDCSFLSQCGSPLSLMAIELTGHDIAATSEDTNWGSSRTMAYVVKNNSGVDKNISSIKVTGTTGCTTSCGGKTGTSGNMCNATSTSCTVTQNYKISDSVSDPKTGGCGSSLPDSLGKVINLSYLQGASPKDSNITGGDLNGQFACTSLPPRAYVSAGATIGIFSDDAWPDWCIGSWGNYWKVLDINFVFADGSSQFFDDVNIPCKESRYSGNGYEGAFDYIQDPDFFYFPAKFWPFHIFSAVGIDYNSLPSVQSGSIIQFLIKNISNSMVQVNKMDINGNQVGMYDGSIRATGPSGEGCNVCGAWKGLMKAPTVTYASWDATTGNGDMNYDYKCTRDPPDININSEETTGLLMDRMGKSSGLIFPCVDNARRAVTAKFYYTPAGSTMTSTDSNQIGKGVYCYSNTGYSGGFNYLRRPGCGDTDGCECGWCPDC
ncbi:MAG: MopE-related protein [Candidatus Diapherotrites archaeon]|nr:MopE-related protein [Candidatus Diapherotrites archaeon]